MGKTRPYANSLKLSWILGRNKAWKSDIIDLANPACRNFIFEKAIRPLHRLGYKNFFLDTLDSYQLVLKDPKRKKAYEDGIVSMIQKIKKRYPNANIILNRGFEIIDRVHTQIKAVLFESLYSGYNPTTGGTRSISESDRKWLLKKVDHIKRYGLDVIALDYLPSVNDPRWKEIVELIRQHGVIPYVATGALDTIGHSTKNALRRRILVLQNDPVDDMFSIGHIFVSLPLEYMGYIPILWNIRKNGTPPAINDRYAAAIVWMIGGSVKNRKLQRWLVKQAQSGTKILFLSNFAFENDSYLLKSLHIKTSPNHALVHKPPKVIIKDKKIIGFESQPKRGFQPLLYHPKKAEKILYATQNSLGEQSVLAAIMPWGGYAVGPLPVTEFQNDFYWSCNPFNLFKAGLHLPAIPIPDPTTENGRRISFTHIDGDAIMNRAEWNTSLLAGDVIYKEILRRYKIPHSVSIVEAEIAPYGLHPKLSPRLMQLARSIYALKNVEAATHTFSHPFVWEEAKDGMPERYRLPVKNYHFTIDREIRGSLEFINKKLLPKGKSPARTIFWSGDCKPGYKVLKYTYAHNFLNMNGGDTIITNNYPWLSAVAPYGIRRGPYYQIYTGAQNENVYTDDWHENFWAFKKVIQTFKLTDYPRRFKPIDIYYHFYSGEKEASLRALKSVFEWVLSQKTLPLYTTEYIPKAMEYYDLSIAHEGEHWRIDGSDTLRTLRLPKELGDPLMKSSVAGFTNVPQGRYVSLMPNPDHSAFITLSSSRSTNPTSAPFLIESNARIQKMVRTPKRLSIDFLGHVPIESTFQVPKGCRISTTPGIFKKITRSRRSTIQFKRNGSVHVSIQCR